MVIRMLAPVSGIVTGVRLGRLLPGRVYDVSDSLAAYLVHTLGVAEEIVSGDRSGMYDPEIVEHVTAGGISVVSSERHNDSDPENEK